MCKIIENFDDTRNIYYNLLIKSNKMAVLIFCVEQC